MSPLKPCIALFSYGGVEGQTFDSLMDELLWAKSKNLAVQFSRVHGDALISRSRSKALSAFLTSTDANVLFMLDHDLEWTTGEVLETCAKAHERQAITGGFYSCRGFGMGMSSRLSQIRSLHAGSADQCSLASSYKSTKATIKMGVDELHDAEYIGGGFLAIPRAVAEEVLAFGKEAAANEQGVEAHQNHALHACAYMDGTEFYDFFRPIVVPSTMAAGKHEFLSEDWAFNWRARQANPNRPQYLWSKPVLRHWGTYGYMMNTAMQKES